MPNIHFSCMPGLRKLDATHPSRVYTRVALLFSVYARRSRLFFPQVVLCWSKISSVGGYTQWNCKAYHNDILIEISAIVIYYLTDL